MTISTLVSWPQPLGVAQMSQVNSKIAEMVAAGKTDGIFTHNPETEQPPIIITRTWTTVVDAEEWVAFVEQWNPLSATIQQT
jgi:hypothetical protein